MFEEKRPSVGVAVIIRCDDEDISYVLFGKRKGSLGEGTWGLPGGHLEFGESLAECAVREVLEETGIKLDPTRITRAPMEFTNDVFLDDEKHYITIFLIAEVDKCEDAQLLEPDRCEKWAWHLFADDDGPPEPAFLPVRNFFDPGVDQLPPYLDL